MEQRAVGVGQDVEVAVGIRVDIVELLGVGTVRGPGATGQAGGVFPSQLGSAICFVVAALQTHGATGAVRRTAVVPAESDMAHPDGVCGEVALRLGIGVHEVPVFEQEVLGFLGVSLHGEFLGDVRAQGQDVVVQVPVRPQHGPAAFGGPQDGCGHHHGVSTGELQLSIGIVHLPNLDVHVDGVVHQVRAVLEQQRVLGGGQGGVEHRTGQFVADPDVHLGVGPDAVRDPPVREAVVDRIRSAVGQVGEGDRVEFRRRDREGDVQLVVVERVGGAEFNRGLERVGVEHLDIASGPPESEVVGGRGQEE